MQRGDGHGDDGVEGQLSCGAYSGGGKHIKYADVVQPSNTPMQTWIAAVVGLAPTNFNWTVNNIWIQRLGVDLVKFDCWSGQWCCWWPPG